MPFVFLLLFALICLQPQWPRPAFGWPTPEACGILVGTMVLVSSLTAGLIANAICWQMTAHPEQRGSLIRRYARWRRWHFIGLLGCFFALLYLLGWGYSLSLYWPTWDLQLADAQQDISGGRLVLPGKEFVLLLPFFAALLLSWERFYGIEKTAYELGHDNDRYLSKPAYLLLQVRHQLLLVMPPVLLLLLQQILFAIFPNWDKDSQVPAFIAIGLMGATFLTMPFLLRVFLGLKPLPPGPLRDRLEQTARRLRFGYSNVLVWHTRHLFANAMVTGFIPWARYVVLTDRLIDELTPEEIEAVFGHEVGHIKHHHLVFYLVFFLTSFILLGLSWEVFKGWLKQDEVMAYLQAIPGLGADVAEIKDTLKSFSGFGKLGLLASYTLLVFGFFSRRCERQADLFGARTVSTDVFINALEKVAAINGIARDRAGNWLLSWQHPTIAQRVGFLEEMRDHPGRIPGFHRRILLIQLAFYAALAYLLWSVPTADLWRLLAEF